MVLFWFQLSTIHFPFFAPPILSHEEASGDNFFIIETVVKTDNTYQQSGVVKTHNKKEDLKMLFSEGKTSDVFCLLPTVIASDTAAATGEWVNIGNPIGDLDVIVNIGVVTAGSIVPSIRTASDDMGTGDTLMVPDEGNFTAVTPSSEPRIQKMIYDARSSLGFIKFVGTITTGPAAVSCALQSHPRYV
jgi:hypothetical protein